MHVLTTTPMAKSENMFSQKIGKDFTTAMINSLTMPLSPQNQLTKGKRQAKVI